MVSGREAGEQQVAVKTEKEEERKREGRREKKRREKREKEKGEERRDTGRPGYSRSFFLSSLFSLLPSPFSLLCLYGVPSCHSPLSMSIA
jgi:hypothetical protein